MAGGGMVSALNSQLGAVDSCTFLRSDTADWR